MCTETMDLTHYQSMFQLAVALNVALSLFKQLRNPTEDDLRKRTISTCTNVNALVDEFKKIQDHLEPSVLAATQANKRGQPLSQTQKQEIESYSEANQGMLDALSTSIEADEVRNEFDGRAYRWVKLDQYLVAAGLGMLFLAMSGLAITTAIPNLQATTAKPLVANQIALAVGILVYAPFVFSLFLGMCARCVLSQDIRKLKNLEKRIFGLRSRLNSLIFRL